MQTKTDSRLKRIFGRLRRTLADMNYAHHRLFELRTGIASKTAVAKREASRARLEELEALWQLEAYTPRRRGA